MYQSPQTFFYEDSPPSSPVAQKIPTFHLSPAPINKAEKTEHRRWGSLSRKPHPSPFSYEYVFEEGKLAGLAEYHPDQDFLHYSSSRGSSTTNSRNPSRRTSYHQSGRSSLEAARYSTESTRHSTESERDRYQRMLPPPSPKKTDKLKRALSLSNTRGRASSDEKRRDPSLPPKSRDLPTVAAVSNESSVAAQITIPVHPLVKLNSSVAFETPRAAPRPPLRQLSKSSPAIQAPSKAQQLELKRKDSKNHETVVKRSSLYAVERKERSFEGPKKPTLTAQSEGYGHIEPVMSGALQKEEKVVVPRPPLRRKTSKFIEHLDDKTFRIELDTEPKTKEAPQVPFLPPFDFQFATAPALFELPKSPEPQSKTRWSMKRSQSLARRAPTSTHPEWPNLMTSAAQKSLPTPPVPKFALGPRTQPLQPTQSNIMRKPSASNTKPSEAVKPTPTSTTLKRATSMRTRPAAMWADVRMAEMKHTLMSPIVASGHARMISC